ncbi:MAG TPA: Crp/Fnr family transcriptional regulator [Hyphomonadaceae bacterium]|nr:Crp/Fnr family transcriptional regulator [Hyphomonadaceae bacterium]
MNRKRFDSTSLRGGPAIRAVDPWTVGNPRSGEAHQLLTDDERARLAVFASLVRFKKGQMIYRGGDPVDAVYNVVSGVVKAFNGRDHISAFLFAGDLVGLSEEGHYVNSARAVTPLTAYRLPIARLQHLLRHDAQLEFHVICKLCQELRQTQRHAFLVSTRDAAARIAMFLQLLEQLQANRQEPVNEIHVPMNRSDIAQYVGLSPAAVSRTFAKLVGDGIIEERDRHHIKVKDRARFDRLSAHVSGASS